MATVNVEVNGRPYSVGCEDGQEQHLETLAKEFDRQVREVGGQVGQVGDLRLFLMAALMGADELVDIKARLAHAQSLLANRQADQTDVGLRVRDALDAAAQRVEDLVNALD